MTRLNGFDNDYPNRTPTQLDDDRYEQPLTHSTYRQALISSSTQVCLFLIKKFPMFVYLLTTCVCVYLRVLICLYSLTKKVRIKLLLLFNLIFGVILFVNRLIMINDKNNNNNSNSKIIRMTCNPKKAI